MGKPFLDTDIESLLEDLNIEYHTSGKNISKNCIGISCPFCGDTSTHLGIFKENKNYSCFICGEKGSLPKLIKELTDLSWAEIFSIIKNYTGGIFSALQSPTIYTHQENEIKIPVGVHRGLQGLQRDYLASRGFDPDYLEQEYDLMSGTEIGKFKFRLVIPVKKQGKITSIVGRDITDKAKLRYKNLAESQSVLPVKQSIYNLDKMKETAILCEGPFDCWAFDPYGIAIFGIKITPVQMYELYLKNFYKIIVCLDQSAQKQAKQIAMNLSTFVPEVKIVILQSGEDPAESAPLEIIDIKKELL
jgi:DNA primase